MAHHTLVIYEDSTVKYSHTCKAENSYPASLEGLHFRPSGTPAWEQASTPPTRLSPNPDIPADLLLSLRTGFTTYSSWHRCHKAWERPHEHQPFLPVTLILEKRPYLTCTTSPWAICLCPSQIGTTVSCTAWPVGAIPISLCGLSCHSHSVASMCQEILGNFK